MTNDTEYEAWLASCREQSRLCREAGMDADADELDVAIERLLAARAAEGA